MATSSQLETATEKAASPQQTTNIEATSAETDPPQRDEEPFSIFTSVERHLITAIVGFTMLFSPLSANIYFPAIDVLAREYNVSINLINLTITSYLILQAIAPVMFGDLADHMGRRPALLMMFTIYTVSNIGLALQQNYPALLVLRMVQSLGCSATVAVGYGIVADIALPSGRGGMLGFAMIATNLGPALAPLVGSVVLQRLGWRWIFWVLTLAGGFNLALIAWVLPETSRAVVGHGGMLPSRKRQPLWNLVLPRYKLPSAATELRSSGVEKECDSRNAHSGRFANPLRSLRILLFPDAAAVASFSGVFYMIYYCIQASISTILYGVYQYNTLDVGLCYLSIGVGVVLGGITNGKLNDWHFRETAARLGVHPKKVYGEGMSNFPIERARLKGMMIWQPLCFGLLAGYGWCLSVKTHVSVPLTMQFLLGFVLTCIVQSLNTLLVDIFKQSSSAAAASGNVMRCALAASGVAGMDSLIQSMGYGWYFTMLALLGLVLAAGATGFLWMQGQDWRKKRNKDW